MSKFLKLTTFTTTDVNDQISLNYDSETKEISIVVPNFSVEHSGTLTLGKVHDETQPAPSINIIAGSGITIDSNNTISIDSNLINNMSLEQVGSTAQLISYNLSWYTQDPYTIINAISQTDGKVSATGIVLDADHVTFNGIDVTSSDYYPLTGMIGHGIGTAVTVGAALSSISRQIYTLKNELPTKTSQLENDSNFLVQNEFDPFIPSGMITNEIQSTVHAYIINMKIPSAGTGLVTNSENIFSIDTNFLSGFVASLGYTTVDNDTIYHADQNTILMTSGNVFSVNSGWLNTFINNKGFATTSAIPTNISQLNNDTGFITGYTDNEFINKLTGLIESNQAFRDFLINTLSSGSNPPPSGQPTPSGNIPSGEPSSSNIQPQIIDENIPLTFTGKNETNAIYLSKIGEPDAIDINYKKNDGEWAAYTIGDMITLSANETVAFSGNNNSFSKDNSNYYRFQMMGTIEADGNIQSLMNFSNNVTDSCYFYMFSGCTALTKAPQMSATELAQDCYRNMYRGCTALTGAPELPATSLAESCYAYMFNGCKSLLSAPVLPATTLVSGCYWGMFANCSDLTSIEVAFTEWDSNNTGSWVQGVQITSGAFTKPAALADSRGQNNIPTNWIIIDK